MENNSPMENEVVLFTETEGSLKGIFASKKQYKKQCKM